MLLIPHSVLGCLTRPFDTRPPSFKALRCLPGVDQPHHRGFLLSSGHLRVGEREDAHGRDVPPPPKEIHYSTSTSYSQTQQNALEAFLAPPPLLPRSVLVLDKLHKNSFQGCRCPLPRALWHMSTYLPHWAPRPPFPQPKPGSSLSTPDRARLLTPP